MNKDSQCIWEFTVQTSCLRASIAVKAHHEDGNSCKGKCLIVEAHLSFRDLIHYPHGRKQVSMQVDMVIEELRVLTS